MTNHAASVMVMNLPFSVRWQDLKDLCRQACPVVRADVAVEHDGRSREFGQVLCKSSSDAVKLSRLLDGLEIQGRKLKVVPLMSSRYSRSNPPYYDDTVPLLQHVSLLPVPLTVPRLSTDTLLLISNLPFSMHWQELKDLLRSAGRVKRTEISKSEDGRSCGWGTALFYTAEEARNAVTMFNDTELGGRTIKVTLDNNLHGPRSTAYRPGYDMPLWRWA